MKVIMNYSLDKINIYGNTLTELSHKLKKILDEKKPLQIVTFNLDFYLDTKRNYEFKMICETSELILPDGAGITSLLYFKYGRRIDRITGHDLFFLLLTIADKNKLKIALVGSTDQVLSKVLNKIRQLFPNCIISDAFAPELYFEENKEENYKVINRIKSSNPDILFLALGSPRQEIWLNKHKDDIGAKINVGIGSVFDYFSGRKKRCPKFLQNIKLEWLWRLLSEPNRLFNRYVINDMPFYIKELIMILRQRKNKLNVLEQFFIKY